MHRNPGLTSPMFKGASRNGQRCGSGFTVIELLVCMGVVAVLVGILLPSLRSTREAAQRLSCANNMRQIGVAISSYAMTNDDRVPHSVNAEGASPRGQELMAARLQISGLVQTSGWDGIGHLVEGGYINQCQCLHCPSHHGNHPYDRYAAEYGERESKQIYSNYHYSGHVQYQLPVGNPHHGEVITVNSGRNVLLLTDGLQTITDFNHKTGLNKMFADMSVEWWYDEGNTLRDSLPLVASVQTSAQYQTIWTELGTTPQSP